MKILSRTVGAYALLAAPFLTGCASNQALRQSLHERDAEIRGLLDDQTAMEAELARLRTERDGLQTALEDAAMRLQNPPATTEASLKPESSYADLKAEGIGYGVRGDHIVFSVPSAVTFASGKAQLTDQGKKALRVLAKRMKTDFGAGARFYVEGHTDTDPIQKSGFESNRHLSLERALAVHGFLVTECEIEDSRFVVVGHGQYDPVAPGDSKESKAKNRRVEVVVHEPGT